MRKSERHIIRFNKAMKRMGKTRKKLLIAGAGMAAAYGLMKFAAKRQAEDASIDDDNPYLCQRASTFARNPGSRECITVDRLQVQLPRGIKGGSASGEGPGRQARTAGTYESRIKPMLDQILSFGGLIVLAPLYGAIALAIKMDDPGSVIFTQKRVGKGKRFFYCHKFRTMKMCTPHDVPTHQLQNPEQYITGVGRILRRTSLDELPQIWDMFRQKMSVIGPRPALWNQEDLIAEREKYGANDVLPGLTGWAQINGRDELEIAEKARLDGEYVRKLKQGGVKALFFDARCFARTIFSVVGSEGVVEGGTGEVHKKATAANISVNDMYALSCLPIRENVDHSDCKKMLIVGLGSYIGNAVKDYLSKTKQYHVDEADAVNLVPDSEMFRGYDIVFFVAGIVHQKETGKNESLYYKVNRDLAIAAAGEAKEAGVKHFILLSSMSVYGMTTGCITKDTKAVPDTHYGKSKLQADNAIWEMRDEKFRVAILRPPMVYGRGCRGNYQLLRKLSVRIPFFPYIKNRRSMIYIGNLCVFLESITGKQKEGVFFPQNSRYVCTSEMVRYIAVLHGKKIKFAGGFDFLFRNMPLPVIRKVFGSLVYEMTEPVGVYSFTKSMEETENRSTAGMKCRKKY